MKKLVRWWKLCRWLGKHRHGDVFFNEPTNEVICLGCGDSNYVGPLETS